MDEKRKSDVAESRELKNLYLGKISLSFDSKKSNKCQINSNVKIEYSYRYFCSFSQHELKNKCNCICLKIRVFVERAFPLKKGRGPIKAFALDPLVIFPGSTPGLKHTKHSASNDAQEAVKTT